MAEFQNAVNSLLGTAAVGTYALNKTLGQDLDVETDANVKFSNENLQETQAKEIQDAKTKVDALNNQEQQLSKQMLDKHPRNEKGQFISQMEHQMNVSKKLSEVNKDLEMARKAQQSLKEKQNLQTALRQATDKQISNLQTRKGLLGKIKANKLSWEEL